MFNGGLNADMQPYFTRDVLAVCLGYHGVFVENVVDHLRSHDYFCFAVDGFGTRVDHLAWFPFVLVLGGGKREQEMLMALVRAL